MHGNWKKSLVAGALCWLLLACGAVDRAEGAEQHVTADDIIRSIAVVRSQLGSVWQNSFRLNAGQQTRAQPVEPFNHGSTSRRGPPLSITFRGIVQTQPPVITFSVTPRFAGHVIDRTTQLPVVATTSTPAENNVPSPMLLDVGFASQDSLARSSPTLPPLTESREAVRANPLGIIFPSPEQLNNFNGGWQRPYQGQDGSAIRTSTTVSPPLGGDFVFPQDEDENLYGGGQAWHQPTSTTTVASSEHSMRVETSSEDPLMTVDPLEQETTEPPEEGLGNRIDQKVLISLLG